MRRADLTETESNSVRRSGGKTQDIDLSSVGSLSESESRFVNHETIFSLHKAASRRHRQKWEFVWNGFRISGHVLDEDFIHKFEKGAVFIEEGQRFKAILRVYQVRDRMSGSWLNKRYEIMKLLIQRSGATEAQV